MSGKLLALLQQIYGDDAGAQLTRYSSAMAEFDRLFGAGPKSLYRVPGRVNLIGEHTDYQQGYVLPVALDKDVAFVVRRRQDPLVRLENMEGAFPPREFSISDDIPSGPKGDWGNYAKGPAQMLSRKAGRQLVGADICGADICGAAIRGADIRGADICGADICGAAIRGADILVSGVPPYGVPRGAGLSSSSALTVGIALILSQENKLGYSPAELAWLSGEAEWYVGTRGGIMDQFIALLGAKDHALFLDCRAIGQQDGMPAFRTEQVPLPEGYQFIVVDSKVRHQNVRSDFNVRVAEGRIGVALLQRTFHDVRQLRDLERYDWQAIEPLLPAEVDWDGLTRLGIRLGDLIDVELPPSAAPFQVRARCRHIVTENARVLQSVTALRDGDIARFARLMNEAHESVSRDYQASCLELDTLVRLARQVDGVLATRMTGAGWGGCIIALAEQGSEYRFVSHVRPHYHDETALWPDIFICKAGAGAGLVASDLVA